VFRRTVRFSIEVEAELQSIPHPPDFDCVVLFAGKPVPELLVHYLEQGKFRQHVSTFQSVKEIDE
jgi:hypothetical protein